jgi:bleomycin hydrolase
MKMKKFYLTFILIATLVASTYSGTSTNTAKGILSPEQIAEIQGSFKMDPPTKAALNAISQNDIRDLAKNQQIWNSLDFNFNNELNVKGITDQQSSGRCWLFATFNVMRKKVIQKYNLSNFEFSENYALFWDKLEKANLFLEYVIMNVDIINSKDGWNDRELVLLLKTPLPDGGFWHMSADVIKKYGAVPKDNMPETHNSGNTDQMNGLIEHRMRIDVVELADLAKKCDAEKKSLKKKLELLRAKKITMLKDIYRMLVLNLGLPPTEFEWRYVDKNDSLIDGGKFTPKGFFEQAVGVDLDEYVVLANVPTQELGKNYAIKLGRGQLEGMDWTFLNVDIQVMKDLTFKVLMDTLPVQFSVDMGQQVSGNAGFMALNLFDFESLLGVNFPFDKSAWILGRECAPNHAMVIVGVDTLAGSKPSKWKIENSWGTDRGEGGFFLMTDEWFTNFAFDIVIEKKYLPEELKQKLDAPPILLPFWDPLARCISVGGWND